MSVKPVDTRAVAYLESAWDVQIVTGVEKVVKKALEILAFLGEIFFKAALYVAPYVTLVVILTAGILKNVPPQLVTMELFFVAVAISAVLAAGILILGHLTSDL